MRKIIICSILTFSLTIYSQKLSDLKFETNVPDAENYYVVFPEKKGDKNLTLGFMYFDETAGYTFDYTGNLSMEGGILKYKDREEAKTSSMKYRIDNLELKSAKVAPELLKSFNLPKEPEWIKFYKSSSSENEKSLRRASLMNGANYPKLALPKLIELYKNNFKTESLYFELTFSYNALSKFAEAEKISDEALKAGKADDLLKKEYIYALVHQNKIQEADVFLTKNLSSFKAESSKIEAMINTIASSAQNNNFSIADKWLKELKSQPNINRYQKNINQLESIIKDKQSKIQ